MHGVNTLRVGWTGQFDIRADGLTRVLPSRFRYRHHRSHHLWAVGTNEDAGRWL